MKKLIICACLLSLSGATAQALSFRNDTDGEAEFTITFGDDETKTTKISVKKTEG